MRSCYWIQCDQFLTFFGLISISNTKAPRLLYKRVLYSTKKNLNIGKVLSQNFHLFLSSLYLQALLWSQCKNSFALFIFFSLCFLLHMCLIYQRTEYTQHALIVHNTLNSHSYTCFFTNKKGISWSEKDINYDVK